MRRGHFELRQKHFRTRSRSRTGMLSQVRSATVRSISAVDFACSRPTGWTINNSLRAADKKGNDIGHLNNILKLENMCASQ
jgi:hypothetical protein